MGKWASPGTIWAWPNGSGGVSVQKWAWSSIIEAWPNGAGGVAVGERAWSGQPRGVAYLKGAAATLKEVALTGYPGGARNEGPHRKGPTLKEQRCVSCESTPKVTGQGADLKRQRLQGAR